MNKNSLIMLALLASLTPISQAQTTDNAKMDKKTSYILGYQMAKSHRDSIVGLNLRAFSAGYNTAYLDRDSLYSENDMQNALIEYQSNADQRALEIQQEKSALNLEVANHFLKYNKDQPNIRTTESGLQYRVIKQGKGASPTLSDTATVHYQGKLLDESVFDDSFERGVPDEFALENVVDGFAEAVTLMNRGATYEFFVPPKLGYGEEGNVVIEPNSLLIFTIELIDFRASTED